MSLSWRRPAHPAPTLIGSSIPEAEKRAICTMQADVMVFMIKRFGIPDKNGFADYLRDRIKSIDADRDVGNLETEKSDNLPEKKSGPRMKRAILH